MNAPPKSEVVILSKNGHDADMDPGPIVGGPRSSQQYKTGEIPMLGTVHRSKNGTDI